MSTFENIGKKLLLLIEDAILQHAKDDNVLLTELRDSDALLKSYIPYFCEAHKRPKTPPPGTGAPELGVLPYWAKMLPVWEDEPSEHPVIALIPKQIRDLIAKMKECDLIPEPTITDEDYANLLTAIDKGLAIGPDGTAYGFHNYEQLDIGWIEAPVNGLLTKYHYGKAPIFKDKDAKPPNADLPTPKPLPFPSTQTTFAVAGDWGTGAGDAVAVRDSIMKTPPDYLMHLGDVYYTGTPKFLEDILFWGPGKEKKHLVDFWPDAMPQGRSFTMNSNHEMYPGAWGLHKDTLSSHIFAHQIGRSFFLLENEHWQIFGMDSAYNSPDFLYMYGALNAEQITFISDNLDTSKKIILLTHHTPYDVTGTIEQIKDGVSLLADVKQAFANAKGSTKTLPDYWYFGHIHDGIVYKKKDGCNMRCTGHASMPYGAPWGLAVPCAEPPFQTTDFIPSVKFFAQTPKPGQKPGQLVMNGYMTFTLNGDQISETFYDSNGTARWSSDPSVTIG